MVEINDGQDIQTRAADKNHANDPGPGYITGKFEVIYFTKII